MQRVRVIEPPEPLVALAEVKKHLVVEHSRDDDLLQTFIEGASTLIDGPNGQLGRAVGKQTLEVSGCFLSRRIRLPCPPVVKILEVTVEDETGTEEIVSANDYRLSGDELVVALGAAWVTRPQHRIRYEAGYVRPDPADPAKLINAVPAPLKVAVMMIVAQWYASREANFDQVPAGAETLLASYRYMGC